MSFDSGRRRSKDKDNSILRDIGTQTEGPDVKSVTGVKRLLGFVSTTKGQTSRKKEQYFYPHY